MARGALVGLALLLGACASDEPCQEYIDYMCECHGDDPEFDCQELEEIYGEADADVQDECAIDLDKQEKQDEKEGVACDA